MPKLIAPANFSWVTPLARPVEKGEEVDVDEEHVDGLVHQGWTVAKARTPKAKHDAPVTAPDQEQPE